MTPTLFGRWQTRIFLLATIGVIVSLPFYYGYLGSHEGSLVYFWILLYVGIFGLCWDILYNYLQAYLWDHDWPGVIQFFVCIAEGIVLGICCKFIGLPHIDIVQFDLFDFIFHYSLVSVITFLSSWVVMRLLFPRWRFKGGAWIGKWPRI